MKLVALLPIVLLACGGNKTKVAKTTPEPTPDKPPADVQKPAPQVTQDQQVSPNVSLSGDLVAQCGIKAAASTNPKFD